MRVKCLNDQSLKKSHFICRVCNIPANLPAMSFIASKYKVVFFIPSAFSKELGKKKKKKRICKTLTPKF